MKRYLREQSQGHHTIDCLEERGAERGSARRSEIKKEAIIKSDEHLNGAHNYYGLFPCE